jgi:hypothetical protein
MSENPNPVTTEAAVTDPAVESEETDVAQNFRKLEEVNKSQKDELAELRPLRDKEKLRDAGFDPDSDRGKALAIAIKAGEVEADTAKLVEYAEDTFGWKPTPTLTPTESQQVTTTTEAKVISTEATSDAPPNIDDQIAEAEKAGNHVEALRLTTRQAAERMLSG